MNDSKYVRLYPERAVAPARAALESQGHVPGPFAEHPRFDCQGCDALAALDALGFPPDEPLLLLRGQDVLAPDVVRAYAEQIVLMEGAFGEPDQAASVIEHIREVADRMERWTPRKLPD